MSTYAWSVPLSLSHAAAIERVTAALAAEGFGVLTRIDAHDTMKAKLDVDFRPYTILGACNPPLALRALSIEPAIGILMPCNVVVEQEGEGSRAWVSDPGALLGLVTNPAFAPITAEVHERLDRVRAALSAAS